MASLSKSTAVVRFIALLALGGLCSTVSSAQDAPYPADGATNVPTTVALTWPATENATSYYLYIGTAARTRDVVNTGEIPEPTYVADGLPTGVTLHVTWWAKLDGQWILAGSSIFTTGETTSESPIAELLNPSVSDEAVPQDLTFTWTNAPGATVYYLYVGSAPGTRDLVNSGETTARNFRVSGLSLDQTIYVRLWTKLSGTWRYRDYLFVVVGTATELTRPVVGEQKVDPATTFEWLRLFGATRYYLYVGTAPGKKDIINSGETSQTSWPNTPLAGGTDYYVRLHSKVAGQWHARDYVIHTDDISLLTAPKNNQRTVDPASAFSWMPVANADSYYLYVGDEPGAKNVVNSGETTRLSLPSRALPGGVALYARLWVKKAGAWRFRDSVFTTRASPRFIYPKHGQIGVTASARFQWTRVVGAEGYTVSVGTTPGSANIVASTVTTGTELDISGLPASAALYATVKARVDGVEVAGQSVFTTNSSASAARLLAPLDGGTLPAGTSVRWRPAVLARAYRLEVGTAPETADLVDTGEIKVSERFVEQLPVGVPLYARLTTYFLSGFTYQQTFTFIKGANDFPAEARISEAERATGFIREQAFGNLPVPNGLLAELVSEAGKDYANCVDYAQALVRAAKQIDLQLQTRVGAGCLVPNTYDCHTFTEVLDPDSQEWFVLDPTFGMTARRTSDLKRATASDISLATREQRWDAIEYAALTSAGFEYAEEYYIDYPLMFFHLYDNRIVNLQTEEESVLHLYEPYDPNALAQSNEKSFVAVRCPADQTSARMIIDGTEYEVLCGGVDNLSEIFPARVVTPALDEFGTIEIYKSSRFTFAVN